MVESVQAKSITEQQLVVFTISSEFFGADISSVREIIKLEQVTKIPNTESYIEGIINLRGKIIVIIDLAKKLGLVSSTDKKNTRVIVSEIRGSLIGFIVDSCNEVMRMSSDKIEEAPNAIKSKISGDYLEGVGKIDGRLVIIINLDKMISESELGTISKAVN